MVKSIVLNSYPSVPMRVLSKPMFSSSPPFGQTQGQPILSNRPRISQYFAMGSPSTKVKEVLELPQTRPLTVVEGYKEMVENRTEPSSTPDGDLKAAAREYFESAKLTSQDSYQPLTKPSVTEKNESTAATALATVQSPVAKPKKKKSSSKKSKLSTRKKPSQFKIVSNKKNDFGK